MLKDREKKRLAAALERQGARVKRTKSGWIIRTDHGTLGFHSSPSSDKNGDKALRKDVERIGLTWPLGG